MGILVEVVEGWSDDLPFTLKADNVAKLRRAIGSLTAVYDELYGDADNFADLVQHVVNRMREQANYWRCNEEQRKFFLEVTAGEAARPTAVSDATGLALP